MAKASTKETRLASIVFMLRGSKSLTADDLAKELGVTVRTVYRDLDVLAAAGLPIRGTPGPSGGYELVEHFPVDPFVYVQADPPTLLGGKSSGVGQALSKAAEFLASSLPTDQRDIVHRTLTRFVFDTSAWFWQDTRLPLFSVLKHAVMNDQVLSIVHVPRGNSGVANAVVEPYGMVWRQGHWYLVACDQSEGRFERYRLSRVLAARPTGRSFARRADLEVGRIWESLLDDFGRGSQMVRLRIDFPATKDFESFAWKADQRIEKYEDHWIVEMQLDDDGWLIPLALSYGDKFQILEPDHLRARVATALESALALYRQSTSVSVPRSNETSGRLAANPRKPRQEGGGK